MWHYLSTNLRDSAVNTLKFQLEFEIPVRSFKAHTPKQRKELHTFYIKDQHPCNLSPRRSTYPFPGMNIGCQTYGNTSPKRGQSGNDTISQTESEDVEDDDIEDPTYMSNGPPPSPTSSAISEHDHEEIFDPDL